MNTWTAVVRERLASISGEPADDELVEELALHLGEIYEDALSGGLSPGDARATALRVLDASDRLREAMQARRPAAARRVADWSRQEAADHARKGAFMSWFDLTRDARHAVRMILRAPVFTAIAVLTFAVGIGVNTAVFNVVNGVLLRPLPYPDADRITLIWLDNRREGIREDITSYPNYRDWRDQNSSYAHVAGYTPASFAVTGAGEPERLLGAETTANFFDVMGVPPLIGRLFTVDNEVDGKGNVVVISYGLWQRQFGGVPDVLGRQIMLNGVQHEIIGVMPASLQWPAKTELWRPLDIDNDLREARGSFWLPVIGRLKLGVSIEQAQTEMSGISARLEQQYPGNKGYGANVVSLQEQLVGKIERPLWVLLSAVGFVLLIACANLTNLMLGRTAARRKELAIRTALGAGRARVIRQIVTESFVLALVGSIAGLALAYGATRFFVTLGGDSIPRADAIVMDWQVLGFALALAMVSALIAGILPAWQASRPAVAEQLREGGRQNGGGASHRTRNTLVAAEIALALVLLTGAGLLIRTLWTMQSIERGFRVDHIALSRVSLAPTAYRTPAEVSAFYSRLLERVRALPGVESAATGTAILQPLVTSSGVFSIEGKPAPPPEERVEYPREIVSPGYFETLQMQVVRGRTFTDQDHAKAPPVVVINETLARAGWGGEDPIGRRIRPGGPNSQAPWMTVIGVIRDAHRAEVTRAIRPEIYFCNLQQVPRTQSVIVRTAVDPTTILPLIRREVQALDPQLPLFNVGTLDGEIAKTLTQPRFQATLLAVFAAIALLLASIGVYGVTSHAVGQRTQEVGIRMALGARRGEVLQLILKQHLTPALVGLAVGIAAALALGQFIQSLLFGVRATDPLTFALMSLALLATAAAACLIPARRAARVDPLNALRAE